MKRYIYSVSVSLMVAAMALPENAAQAGGNAPSWIVLTGSNYSWGGYVPRSLPPRRPQSRCYVKRHHLSRLNHRCNKRRRGSYFSVITCRCELLI